MLLTDILDFLIQIKRYKDHNLMDAYHLGEAMGKVTLAPNDACDPILADKASHFLTRLIIERARSSPMSPQEATRAKARSYQRIILGIHRRNFDWLEVVQVSLYALMEDSFEYEPLRPQEPYLSIFCLPDPSAALESPVLYRLLTYRQEPIVHVSLQDALKRNQVVEREIKCAFDDFLPLLKKKVPEWVETKPVKKSLKKKHRMSEDTVIEKYTEKPNHVKSMMKKMIKIAPLNHNKMLSAFQ
ncbi:hypothetical protein G6F56_009968 [Rhizopus delemar]|uniref:Uncharacterized protein n=1 Tax=Rhizopus stolonifer TaxID=4846 RepID=A0A367IQ96_RHIST|nr:hypothetical protein G6F56_009968 [Rhizopus delemar]RCH79858.1 hypothetical protein CU098_007281 [Rhizopus stolonifer]